MATGEVPGTLYGCLAVGRWMVTYLSCGLPTTSCHMLLQSDLFYYFLMGTQATTSLML